MTPLEVAGHVNDYFSRGQGHILTDPEKTAFRMALIVLEKQIPKDPIWEDNRYADEEYDTWYCPSCDTRYVDEEHKFCPECGQAIKWSD